MGNQQIDATLKDLLRNGVTPQFIAASFGVELQKVKKLKEEVEETTALDQQKLAPKASEALALVAKARQELAEKLEIENSTADKAEDESNVDYVSRRLYGRTVDQTLLDIIERLREMGTPKALRSAGDLTVSLLKVMQEQKNFEHRKVIDHKKVNEDEGSESKFERLLKSLQHAKDKTKALDAKIIENRDKVDE